MATSGTISATTSNALPASLYRLTAPTGKSYVGITTAPVNRRWREHARAAKNNSPFAIHAAIRKYGWNAFKKEILVIASFEYVKELEKKAVAAFGTKSPCGYNLTDGGDGVLGFCHDEQSRSKNSAGVKAAWLDDAFRENQRQVKKQLWEDPSYRSAQVAAHLGYKASDSHKKNISAALKACNRKLSDDQRRAISERMKGRPSLLCGRKLSAEHKSRLSSAQVGRELSLQHVEKLIAACATRSVLKCPHCQKQSTSPAMYHWHFDNCKKRSA